MFKTLPFSKRDIWIALLLCTALVQGACTHESTAPDPDAMPPGAAPHESSFNADGVQPSKGSAPVAPGIETNSPPLAVATVASLLSVSDVMVREPERFKKVLCSDSKFYDLQYDGRRFSLPAEPLSVCVLLADTKDLKPIGICADESCEASTVTECSPAEKQALVKQFAVDQTVQRCWNIGAFPPLSYSVLMTRVGQSCQAQTLVKKSADSAWLQLNTIDGTYEARKTNGSEGTGCWWEAGTTYIFEGDWFNQGKKVLPVMAFQKDGGLYTLLRSNWSGTDNFQLFRLDGEAAVEVESFAESFKDIPSVELNPPPEVSPASQDAKTKSKVKMKAKNKASKKNKSASKSAPDALKDESLDATESLNNSGPAVDPTLPPPEPTAPGDTQTPEKPQSPLEDEKGVNPLDGD